jgi:hypothetical protein
MRAYAAADAAAETEGDDCDAGVATCIDRLHDVVDLARAYDAARPRRAAAQQIFQVAQNPIVVAAFVECGGVGEDRGRSEQLGQMPDERIAHA